MTRLLSLLAGALLSATSLVAADRLDLDDLGTEPGEQLRAPRQRLHLLDREDPDTVERLAVLRRLRVRHVTQLHDSPLRVLILDRATPEDRRAALAELRESLLPST